MADGYVNLHNVGAFVARFLLDYTVDGKNYHESSGDITAGDRASKNIPQKATNINFKIQVCTGLAWHWWADVLNANWDAPVQKCYEVSGTTLNAHAKEVTCPK
ncbi:MAG TPA: thiol-activated cytolysin C-terminal domain-containing protein [Methanothrix sp.]|nr:thiol-activated cytolysin C-terminal domain-containing protein [Methanothrix sp.]